MFQSEHVVLIYSWNVSLVRSWWESAHIRFNLWSVYYVFIWWDILYHEVSCIQCQQLCWLSLWYLSGHIQYLKHTVSIGNRFPWLYINFFRTPWFRCIIIESGIIPWWVSRGAGGSCMFLKKRGDEKGKGVGRYTFPHYAPRQLSLWVVIPLLELQFNKISNRK